MFGLSFGEVLIIGIIALVLFGKEDLPQTLRKFTKGFQEFKKVTHEAQRSWQDVKDDVSRTIMQADIEEEVKRNLREAEKKLEAGIEETSKLTLEAKVISEVEQEHLSQESEQNLAHQNLDDLHNPDGTLKSSEVLTPTGSSPEIVVPEGTIKRQS